MEDGIHRQRRLIDSKGELDVDYNNIMVSLIDLRIPLHKAEILNDKRTYNALKKEALALKRKVDNFYNYIKDDLNIEMANYKLNK